MTGDSAQSGYEVVGYELAKIDHSYQAPGSVFGWLEAFNAAVYDYAACPSALAELYPALVRLTALGVRVIEQLPAPGEIEGLVGFEGLCGTD